jgi:hypothetical protein
MRRLRKLAVPAPVFLYLQVKVLEPAVNPSIMPAQVKQIYIPLVGKEPGYAILETSLAAIEDEPETSKPIVQLSSESSALNSAANMINAFVPVVSVTAGPAVVKLVYEPELVPSSAVTD